MRRWNLGRYSTNVMIKKNRKNKGFRSQVRPLDNGVEFASGVCCDYEFPPHVHAGLTLGLVVSGREEIQYKNSVTRVERGAIYLIPPDTIHAARSYEKADGAITQYIFRMNTWSVF